MARKKNHNANIDLFCGREATLNIMILKVFEKKSPLIGYDVWRQLRAIKGFRHTDSKTAYRRIEALHEQGWIVKNGTRVGKRGGEKILFELTLKGKAAIRLYETSMDEFIKTATDRQLLKFIDSVEFET